jgi:hypothetical protein
MLHWLQNFKSWGRDTLDTMPATLDSLDDPDSDICLGQAIFCWVALARKILMSLPEEFETAFF